MNHLYYCYVVHKGDDVHDGAVKSLAERDAALRVVLDRVVNPDMVLVGAVRSPDVNSALARVRAGDWDFTKR